MMEETNEYGYKQEIIDSRKGFLGGSDAAMLRKIERAGMVLPAYNERLAIVKGLYEKKDDIKTAAMSIGDEVENLIYESLVSQDSRWQSNPRIVSDKYHYKNVGLLCHPDYALIDEEKKHIIFIECKATEEDINTAHKKYIEQLYVEYALGREMCKKLGSAWKFAMRLCHYNTNGYSPENFDLSKLETQNITFHRPPFNIAKAMSMVNSYLETMTEYYREDITAEYLPADIQDKFSLALRYMQEIADRKKQIDTFKKQIYDVMTKHNIKSIKNDIFTITRVDDSVSQKFDTNKFKNDHVILYRKYLINSKKKGYALLKLKNNRNEAE